MVLPRLGISSSRLVRLLIYNEACDGVPLDPASRRRTQSILSIFTQKNVRSDMASDRSPDREAYKGSYMVIGIGRDICVLERCSCSSSGACQLLWPCIRLHADRSSLLTALLYFVRLSTPLLCLSCKLQVQRSCASSSRANSVLLSVLLGTSLYLITHCVISHMRLVQSASITSRSGQHAFAAALLFTCACYTTDCLLAFVRSSLARMHI